MLDTNIKLPDDINAFLDEIVKVPAEELPSYEEIKKNKGYFDAPKDNGIADRSVDDTFSFDM